MKKIETLHEHRNTIAHVGEFKDEDEAQDAFKSALEIIQAFAPNEAKKTRSSLLSSLLADHDNRKSQRRS